MGSALVTTILTGGGFAGIVTLMGYLFTVNKNKADAAGVIATGAAGVVTMLEKRLQETEHERDVLKAWARRKREADAEHSRWDRKFAAKFDHLLLECQSHDIAVSEEPIGEPPSLEVPFNGYL